MTIRKKLPLKRLACEWLEERVLLTVFMVTNTSDSGAGSLRQAILDADADTVAGADTIDFNIGAVGSAQTITPASQLPDITNSPNTTSILLDGFSQGGAGYTGPPLITIDGNVAPSGGLVVNNANNVEIRGFSVVNFGSGEAIAVTGSSTLIDGNYIGMLPDGVTPAGNAIGIHVSGTTGNTTIGGSVPGAGNVISGNVDNGIEVYASGIGPGTDGVQIQGNYIGVQRDGTTAAPNGGEGIDILNATNTIIGGVLASEGNVIAFNGGSGVRVIQSKSLGETIRGNSIHSNGKLGIDLNGDGVTPNDAGDADTGPNGLQNFPVITSVIPGANTEVIGTLNSTPNTSFDVDFYANDTADPSGFGQGQRYLGSATVMTDGSGNANFDVGSLGASLATEVIAATATGPDGTSEFSQDFPLPLPTLSIGSVSQNEGNSGTTPFVFNVTLSAAASQPVTVQYATNDGTATVADNDYVPQFGTLTFAAGTTTQTITISVNGDTTFENDETFKVDLSNPTANATIGTAEGLGTIVNDDAPPTLSINNVSQARGTSGTTSFVFTVTQSPASGATTALDYSTADGTAVAPGDYVAQSSSLTFLPGTTSQNITITVNGSTTATADETFFVNLTDPSGATLANSQGTGTLLLAPLTAAAQIRLEVVDPTTLLPITQLNVGDSFLLRGQVLDLRSPPLAQGVFAAYLNVLYSSNLVSITGPITYGPNYTNVESGGTSTAGAINEVGATDGGTPLGPNEQLLFSVPLTATHVGVASFTADPALDLPQHDVLEYNDNNPVPQSQVNYISTSATIGLNSLAIDNVAQDEGNSGVTPFVFTVTRAVNNGTSTVAYSIDPGTAKPNVDYIPQSGTLTFGPRVNSQTVTVSVLGNTLNEANETFFVDLSNPANAQLGTAQGVGMILNDDPVPTMAIADASAKDGSVLNFVVSLSAASGQPITVQYATSDGTAVAGLDYTAASGTLTFAPGVTQETIPVASLLDPNLSANETFQVALSNPVDTTLTTATAAGTIVAIPRTADLTITKTDGKTTVVPGTLDTYTIVVTNAGPDPVTGASIADTFPFVFTGAAYTAVATGGAAGFTPSGSGNIDDTVVLMPAGSTITYTVTGTVSSSATGSLVNTAAVAPPVGTTDPTLANNTATDTDTLTPQAPIALVTLRTTDLSGNPISTVQVGQDFLLEADVRDLRTASPGGYGVFAAYLDVAYASALASTALPFTYGAGFSSDKQGTVAPGQITDAGAFSGNLSPFSTTPLPSAQVLWTLEAHAVAVGSETFSGLPSPAAGNDFLVYGDNSAVPINQVQIVNGTIQVTPAAAPTLSINNVSLDTGTSGITPFVFTVTLSPAAAQTVTVQYTTADSTATVADNVYTAQSGTLTFAAGTTTENITVPVQGGATTEPDEMFLVQLINPLGATIVSPPGIGTILNDTSEADLAVRFINLTPTVAPGASITYSIQVTNRGPSSVRHAGIFEDTSSPLLGMTYTAVGTVGASGFTAGGSGEILEFNVDLPAGSTITYTVTGTVNPAASGTLFYGANVFAPLGVTDPNQANNTVTYLQPIANHPIVTPSKPSNTLPSILPSQQFPVQQTSLPVLQPQVSPSLLVPVIVPTGSGGNPQKSYQTIPSIAVRNPEMLIAGSKRDVELLTYLGDADQLHLLGVEFGDDEPEPIEPAVPATVKKISDTPGPIAPPVRADVASGMSPWWALIGVLPLLGGKVAWNYMRKRKRIC